MRVSGSHSWHSASPIACVLVPFPGAMIKYPDKSNLELFQLIVGEVHHGGEVTWQELEAADHIASAVKK